MPGKIKNLDLEDLGRLDINELKNVYRITKESIRNFMKKGRSEDDIEIIKKMKTIEYIEGKLNIRENKKYTIPKYETPDKRIINKNLSIPKLSNLNSPSINKFIENQELLNENFRETFVMEIANIKNEILALHDELDKKVEKRLLAFENMLQLAEKKYK